MTRVRERYCLDAAQIVLGHADADVTQVYAWVNRERLVQVMGELGLATCAGFLSGFSAAAAVVSEPFSFCSRSFHVLLNMFCVIFVHLRS